MTQINSGNITTGNITPTGGKKMLPVDNPYVCKDEFITHPNAAGLGLTALSTEYINGSLDRILLRASAQVNRICRRYFDTQTVDETKTGFRAQPFNPQLTSVTMNNRPFQKVNSLWIQVLKWFIQIDTTSNNSYLQEFPDYGYIRIVPLLSTSNTGAGSPIPAAILDKVALGVLWTNYTFGYGTPLTGQTLTGNGAFTVYQAPLNNRLWAKAQANNPLNIYVDGVLQTTGYTIDYPNGTVTFTTPLTALKVVTADFTTNDSVPMDIKEATILFACYMYGQGMNNPLGVSSYSMQTFSMSNTGVNDNPLLVQAKEMLQPYVNNMPKII